MSVIAPSAAERDRFAAALTAFGGIDAGTPLLVAVSGGPDSMAMLVLAAAARPGGVLAATVDHGLRSQAADEARLVARHCAALGVPHATLGPDGTIVGASMQARARALRYRLLGDEARRTGALAVATAHHADDAAETFLMRAARGSGLAGLAGVRPSALIEGVWVVRPLLDWRRAELRALARRTGTPFVDDPANRDDRHDRTRFRRLLEANEWLDPPRLAQAATALATADSDVRAFVDWAWDDRADVAGIEVTLEAAGLPRELARRLVRRATDRVRGAAGITESAFGEASNVEPLLDALTSGRRATQAGVMVTPRGTMWRFGPAPPRKR